MRRRGFTLVEILAALVLLGMIAGAALPMVRGIRAQLAAPPPPAPTADLGTFADLLDLAAPAYIERLRAGTAIDLPWHAVNWDPAGGPPRPVPADKITITVVTEGTDRYWVSFASAGAIVYRSLDAALFAPPEPTE